MGEKERLYLPHAVTVNEYLERLDPEELQKVQHKQVYELIRRKTFDDAKLQKKRLVIVDGPQTYSGNRKLNDECLKRHYNKGTDEETVNMLRFWEEKISNGKKVRTRFQWLTSIRITERNAEKIAGAGRKR